MNTMWDIADRKLWLASFKKLRILTLESEM